MPDNKCRWKPKSFYYHECNEPALPNDPDSYCILHSKKDDKDIEQFKEKVRERIKEGRLTPGGWEINIVDFKGCYFPKDFPSDYFRNCTFDKPVYFNGATFSQVAEFNGATFSRVADFFGAKFSQEANFIEAKFSQGANFLGVTFPRVADFIWATFSQEVNFTQVKFMGRTLFQYIHIPGEVIFQDVDLSQCSFLHSNIDKVDFRYCTFAKKGRRKNVLRDELECDKEVKKAKRKSREEKKKVREEGYEPVRRVYLELKRNFEEKKDWNTAGDFHFGEMECRRQKMPCWKRYFWSLEFWYWLTSGYCERPLRAFIVLLGLVGVFSLLYMPTEKWNYFTSLRDSLNVAKLMRLGNSMGQDPGWGKFIVALFEIILVPIQTALLALALRRKVKR